MSSIGHVHVATEAPGSLTPASLRDGTRGFYAGVILNSTSLGYSPDGGTTWLSALSTDEWATLEQYERDFGARRLNWYGFPGPNQGLNWATATVDTFSSPITANWTDAAISVFPYLKTSNSLTISNVWTYLATPLDTNTTVWLQDDAGNALLSTATLADGREVATMTFDSATYLVSSTIVRHGLISWVSGGMFLGQRHTYLTAQIDDVFLDDDIYTGGSYRQNSNDWHAKITWQQNYNQRPAGTHFKYDMAFNGRGTLPGVYANDDLTPYATATEGVFKWISHTFTHPYLTHLTYDEAMPEIVKNNQRAAELGLTDYSPASMVTPNITGLENPSFLNAAYDAGVRYLVTDTSIDYHRAPSPNAGIPNLYVPGILMIPRHANNLFYNVSTPTEWETEYNDIFRAYWGRDLTYAEILDNQSDLLLKPLLKGDVSPQMFHQPNLRDFNGQGNTLLGDLLDQVADKYEYYYNFPFLSPTQDGLGVTVQERMDYNASGVTATRNGDGSVTVSVKKGARVPVTGLRTAASEFYAGQWITHLTLGDNQSVTFTPDAAGLYVASTNNNTAPVAMSANYSVPAGKPLAIALAATDAEGDVLTYAVTSLPTFGQITGAAPFVTYVPEMTQTGQVNFTFSVTDGQAAESDTITIDVIANVNNLPTANEATHTTQTNTPIVFHMTGTDPDGDELTFLIASQPAMGEVEFDEFVRSKVTYTPNAGMAGTVSVDGNLAEWVNVASAGSGLDVPDSAGNQIDLVSLKITHDDNNLYIAYENENPVVLNWGYTLYLDIDRNPNTGFAMWQIGADIVIQGNGVYSLRRRRHRLGLELGHCRQRHGRRQRRRTRRAPLRHRQSRQPQLQLLRRQQRLRWHGLRIRPRLRPRRRPELPPLQSRGEREPVHPGRRQPRRLGWRRPARDRRRRHHRRHEPNDLLELHFTNDVANFYLGYVNDGPITLNWGYTLYLDTDANAATGFRAWGVGAEFVIQGGEIYQYAGTGNDWAWNWVGSMEVVVNGNVAEAAFPKTLLGTTGNTIRMIFEGKNAASGGAGLDKVPNNLNNFLSYTVQ